MFSLPYLFLTSYSSDFSVYVSLRNGTSPPRSGEDGLVWEKKLWFTNSKTTQAIVKIVKKFEEAELLTNIERPVHYRFTRSAENVAIWRPENPNVAIPRRPLELGLS